MWARLRGAMLLWMLSTPLAAALSCEGPCDEKGTCGEYDGPLGGTGGRNDSTSGGVTQPESGSGGSPSSGGAIAGGSITGGGEAGDSGEGGTGPKTDGGAAGQAGMAGDAGNGGVGGESDACQGACKPPTAICTDGGECVECLKPEDCAQVTGRPLCDTDKGACVACLADKDCGSAATSHCVAGICAKCTKDEECTHITGKGLCTAAGCAQCSVQNEKPCGDFSCNPKTLSCTKTTRASVRTCGACLADSECKADHACVPMKFGTTQRPGGYCLQIKTKYCPPPYYVPLSGVASLSGVPNGTYCGIDTDETTCEAVVDMEQSAACGPPTMSVEPSDSLCACRRDAQG
ncbi:MAG TPA: hypothetical protein VFQ61_22495, partial [Polyangiaceae bacterium]|nr:hypothetical protein [Polyangiaceae bacterium]